MLSFGPTATAQAPAVELPTRFTNISGTFALDLPRGFRQLAPNEARTLAERSDTPRDLRTTSPRAFYAVGDVDSWLQDAIVSPWLYVMEQEHEWHIDGDFPTLLRDRWTSNGEETGTQYEISDVREAEIGPGAHSVWLALRTSRPTSGPAVRSLDVYAPTGGRQVTLSFCAFEPDFAIWQATFERALATLTFSRPPRGEVSMSDRMWTPIITGALVGLILLVLYKHTRNRTRQTGEPGSAPDGPHGGPKDGP